MVKILTFLPENIKASTWATFRQLRLVSSANDDTIDGANNLNRSEAQFKLFAPKYHLVSNWRTSPYTFFMRL